MEMTFQQLAEEIPKGKRWGIYSTSVLWGILLITLETAVGGGFTLLDAVLDSVLAPFITKGATELFAYGEIQKAARELGKRYCEGLLSALHLQKRHYIECLWAVMPTSEHVACIRALNGSIGKHMREAEKSR
jgi:hypothetical protein